ncbi:hypothetical protein QJS10_CPB19g00938 [Acorus calamus]|uniref:Uncharacterized protein n=1 Tax=Acorus calamus TaxID=4465 RepID=A0AAV9CH57_ACOCL|nr:hypothetical protein QJS10_CPB19g00938 [Acorus calamus]
MAPDETFPVAGLGPAFSSKDTSEVFRWKLSCDQALESPERKRYRYTTTTTTTTGVGRGFGAERSRACRTNSFQDEAISDCLEFIKRTSISIDDGSIDGCRRD